MTSSASISSSTDPLDLAAIPLLDHHAHAVRRDQSSVDPALVRRSFSESTDPVMDTHLATTIVYRRAIRDLAAFLGCEPTEAAVLAARSALPFADLMRRCFAAANIKTLLLDSGFQAALTLDLGEMAALSCVPVLHVLRLETYVEELIGQIHSLSQLEEALRLRIREARAHGTVALKSIAAYRGGLQVEPRSAVEAGATLSELRTLWEQTGAIRLTQRPLIEYLLYVALEEAAAIELPVQFHVAFGDDDADLRLANPLHLRPLLHDRRLRGAPIVLLHCYPYVREAGYLASLYANVYVDVSLSVPLTGAGSRARFAEALELAPTTKVLFATDAHSIPELFYIAALHGRHALAHCLSELIALDYLTSAEAEAIAQQILWQNASRLYGVAIE
ncbi:MAG TPA: amidohydrolase family protein [Herpetosiphonaceae bacterium]